MCAGCTRDAPRPHLARRRLATTIANVGERAPDHRVARCRGSGRQSDTDARRPPRWQQNDRVLVLDRLRRRPIAPVVGALVNARIERGLMPCRAPVERWRPAAEGEAEADRGLVT